LGKKDKKMNAMDSLLNVLHICETGTTQLGPGLRYCLWVQGCPFNCKGCTTPEGIPIVPNQLISIESIYTSIISNNNISGITISGGEPFLQASKLSILLESVLKNRPELNIIIYTGFKRSQLNWQEALKMLKYIDVLIDGHYIKKYDDNKGLRGSSNQKIHHLTERLIEHQNYFENRERSLDVFVQNGQAVLIGIPNQNITI